MKPLKFILIVVLFIFQSSVVLAQGGNSPKIPEFKSNHVVKIIKYFEDDVFKKAKINDATTQQEVSSYLREFNLKMEEITLLNKDVMDISEMKVNQSIKDYEMTKDVRSAKETMRKVMEDLEPIEKQVDSLTTKLDKDFENILNRKQFKKWLKYKRTELKKIFPEVKSQNNNEQRPGHINSIKQQRDMRLRGY